MREAIGLTRDLGRRLRVLAELGGADLADALGASQQG